MENMTGYKAYEIVLNCDPYRAEVQAASLWQGPVFLMFKDGANKVVSMVNIRDVISVKTVQPKPKSIADALKRPPSAPIVKETISKDNIPGSSLPTRVYWEQTPDMAFDTPYKPDPTVSYFSFSAALLALKTGRRVSRRGWNGKDQWLKLQRPDMNSKMTKPYIYIRTVQGDLVPWLASQTDLLAEDWFVAGV